MIFNPTNISGGSATIEPLSVTANGTYTAPSGVDGYSPVTVNVSGGGGGFEPITVTVTNYQSSPYSNLYYTDDTGTAQMTTSDQFTCASKTIFIILEGVPEPTFTGYTFNGATLKYRISMGTRANYKYIDIVQAN